MSVILVQGHAQEVCCCQTLQLGKCCTVWTLRSRDWAAWADQGCRQGWHAWSPHPDCFLVLGICSLLLLLGSMVALAATPAACAVSEGQHMQCMAWQQALQATEDLTHYRAKGFPRACYMLGDCQLTSCSKRHCADSLLVQGLMHARRQLAALTAPSNTDSLGRRSFGQQVEVGCLQR